MAGDELRVERADFGSPVAQTLVAALNAELTGQYPEPGATHFRLDREEVASGRGAFLIASVGDIPVGCGAVRRLDAQSAEVKRMYVIPAMRGRGVGRAILAALEAEARALGVARLLLETGIRQADAIALYERMGFSHIPPFGEYVASAATSVCMTKDL